MSSEDESEINITGVNFDKQSEEIVQDMLEEYADSATLDVTDLTEYGRLAKWNDRSALICALSVSAIGAIVLYAPSSLFWSLLLIGCIGIFAVFVSILVIAQKELDFDKYTSKELFEHHLGLALQHYWNEEYEETHKELLESRKPNTQSSVFHPRNHAVLLHYTNRVDNTANPDQAIENTFENVVYPVLLRELQIFAETRADYENFPDEVNDQESQARSTPTLFIDASKNLLLNVSRTHIRVVLLTIAFILIGLSYILYEDIVVTTISTVVLIVFAITSPDEWIMNRLQRTRTESEDERN